MVMGAEEEEPTGCCFRREESFWDTDGDTAERKRERGQWKIQKEHHGHTEKISVTQSQRNAQDSVQRTVKESKIFLCECLILVWT